jgi:glycosyltransferase involved in cell wall biosynthesis
MKILRVIATLDPRHGGPAAGLSAITPALAALGHETTFACADAPVEPAASWNGGAVHALGPARGSYAYSPRLAPWLDAHAAEFDAVFVHGLWQYHGRATRAALRGRPTPYFVFPHGMLDPWFRRAYPLKHAKKWLYWKICERHILRDAAAVLFTCDEERRLARESFRPYACTERVVNYGTSAPTGNASDQCTVWRDSMPELGARPFWLFLGRVHPKKGVDHLLQAYRQLGFESGASLPALVLAGPCSDARYRTRLDEIVARLPPPCRVFWTGMIEGDRKWGALRCAEAFVLPSHQENFGLAVVEALATGTPVLISNKINIWSEITACGAGFAETDDADGTTRLLRRWQLTAQPERDRMHAAAGELFERRYEIARVAQSLIQTVEPFVSATPSPPFHESTSPNDTAYRVG